MTENQNRNRRVKYANDEAYREYYKEKAKRYFAEHKEDKKLYMRKYRRKKLLEKFENT